MRIWRRGFQNALFRALQINMQVITEICDHIKMNGVMNALLCMAVMIVIVYVRMIVANAVMRFLLNM